MNNTIKSTGEKYMRGMINVLFKFIQRNCIIKAYKTKYLRELKYNYNDVDKAILRNELEAELLRVKGAIWKKVNKELIVIPSIIITIIATVLTVYTAYAYNVTDLNTFEKAFEVYEGIPDNIENVENQELIKKYFGLKEYSKSEIEKLKIEQLNKYKENISDDINVKGNIGKNISKFITMIALFPILYIIVIILFYACLLMKNNIQLITLRDYIVERLQEEVVIDLKNNELIDKMNKSWINVNDVYIKTEDILKIEEMKDKIHIFYLRDKKRYL